MIRVMLTLFSLVSVVLMTMGLFVSLSMGGDQLMAMLASIVAGFVSAVPLSLAIGPFLA